MVLAVDSRFFTCLKLFKFCAQRLTTHILCLGLNYLIATCTSFTIKWMMCDCVMTQSRVLRMNPRLWLVNESLADVFSIVLKFVKKAHVKFVHALDRCRTLVRRIYSCELFLTTLMRAWWFLVTKQSILALFKHTYRFKLVELNHAIFVRSRSIQGDPCSDASSGQTKLLLGHNLAVKVVFA